MKGTLHDRLWSRIAVGEPDECWPFTGYKLKGYGRIGLGGRKDGVAYAHRVVAEEAHGPCPPGQSARHLCGNAVCCNPRHLAWGDQSANENDKRLHGRDNRGSRHGMAKLNASQVRAIRRRIESGHAQTVIANEFGISQQTVSEINRRLIWGWLS